MPRAKPVPSQMFLDAIRNGFEREAAGGREVTPSGIWDRVCMHCFVRPGAFLAMFSWDTRKGEHNRIGTIRETIAAGLVPELRLARNSKGHEVVIRWEA
jgi:hypothetical protein